MKRMTASDIDFAILRKDFPIFSQTNRGKPLVYLDSAASAQKPQKVIDAITQFYSYDYANIHRGIYELSERATALYEKARQTVQQFIHAKYAEEIIFVRGATEGINLVAQCMYQHAKWQRGDEIILSELEHHSNIVPWYQLQEQQGIKLQVVPVNENGSLNIDAYKNLFSERTKMVALSHVSNALGNINPVNEMIAIARAHAVPVLIDGAQAVPHMLVDVQALDADFYVFSGHKCYGPTGAGVLYGKKKWLDVIPPYQTGGEMIEMVSFAKTTFAKLPHRFEAGTPDIASVIGLGAAIDYLQAIGMNSIFEHEQRLLSYAEKKLLSIDGLKIIGTAKPKVGVISFVMDDIHPHDIGTILDHEGIAVRAGHHCAMPLMQRMGVSATARASFGLYNHEQDIDALCQALELSKRFFI